MIYIPYFDNGSNQEGSGRDEAYAEIEQAKSELIRGKDFRSVAEKYNKDNTCMERVFDDTTARIDYRMYAILTKEANSLTVGKESDVIEENGGFYIIKCIDKKGGWIRALYGKQRGGQANIHGCAIRGIY